MADLSAFATKDNADEGVILPVRIKGKKFPLAIKVYGSDSDVVKEYEREKIRLLGFGRNKKTELDDDEFEELLESDEGVIIRMGGIYSYDWKKKTTVENDPVTLFGKTLGCDEKSYAFLVEKLPAIKEWVIENSNNRDNFLSLGKKN